MFGDPVDNPMGWPMRKLSDVAKVDGTMTKEYEKYADYPHIGIDSIEKNTGILSGYRTVQEDNVISPKYYFGPQHILYSKIRPALNKVALPDFEGLCSADCYPLLVNGLCDRKFLAHVMRSDYFLDHVLSYSGRSQMPKVNRKQLEGFSFPCPPIDLQEKFTALIDQSDKSKFTGFKSQFIEMFGDPVDNPMGWPMRKLSDVAKVDGTMTKEYEKYADYPHIGIDSIEKNTGILSGYRTVQEDNVISPKYYFGPQHILYSKIRPALNKVALPDFEGLCSADCYPLLVNGLCDRKFLAHVMRSDYFLDHVLSYSGRSQMPKVNRKQLEGFSFPCPPIDLQEKFTALIDQSDKSK